MPLGQISGFQQNNVAPASSVVVMDGSTFQALLSGNLTTTPPALTPTIAGFTTPDYGLGSTALNSSLINYPAASNLLSGALPLNVGRGSSSYPVPQGYQIPDGYQLALVPITTNPRYTANYQQPQMSGVMPATYTGLPAQLTSPYTARMPIQTPNYGGVPMSNPYGGNIASFMPMGNTMPSYNSMMPTSSYQTSPYTNTMTMPQVAGFQTPSSGLPRGMNPYADLLASMPSTTGVDVMASNLARQYGLTGLGNTRTSAYTPTMGGMGAMQSPYLNTLNAGVNYGGNSGSGMDAATAAAMYANSVTNGQMGTSNPAIQRPNQPLMSPYTMGGMAGTGIPGAVAPAKPGTPTMYAGGHIHDFTGDNKNRMGAANGKTEFTSQFREAHARHFNGAGGSMMFDATGSNLAAGFADPNLNTGQITKKADGKIEVSIGVDTTLAGYRAAIDRVKADNPNLKAGTKEYYNKVGREIQNLNDSKQIKAGNKQDGVSNDGITDTMGHWTGTTFIDATGMTGQNAITIRNHQANESEKFNDFSIGKDGYAYLVSRNDNGGGDPNNFNNGHNMGASAVIKWKADAPGSPTNLKEALKIVKMQDDDDNTGVVAGGKAIIDAITAEGSYKGARDNGGKIAEGTTTTASKAAMAANAKYMPGMGTMNMGTMNMGGAAGASSMPDMNMGPATGAYGAAGGYNPVAGSAQNANRVVNDTKAFGINLTGNQKLDEANVLAALQDYYRRIDQQRALYQTGGGGNPTVGANYTQGLMGTPQVSSMIPGVQYPGANSYLTNYLAGLQQPSYLPVGTGNYNQALIRPYVVVSGNNATGTGLPNTNIGAQPVMNSNVPILKKGSAEDIAAHTYNTAHGH